MRNGTVTRRGFLHLAAAGDRRRGQSRLAARDTGGARRRSQARGECSRLWEIEPAVGFNPVLEGTNWPERMRMV